MLRTLGSFAIRQQPSSFVPPSEELRAHSQLIATHSLTSTYLGGATMVLNEPLTSAALMNGFKRKSGFGSVGDAGWPENSAPGETSGASYCCPPGTVMTGERLGARRRLHVSYVRRVPTAFAGGLAAAEHGAAIARPTAVVAAPASAAAGLPKCWRPVRCPPVQLSG